MRLIMRDMTCDLIMRLTMRLIMRGITSNRAFLQAGYIALRMSPPGLVPRTATPPTSTEPTSAPLARPSPSTCTLPPRPLGFPNEKLANYPAFPSQTSKISLLWNSQTTRVILPRPHELPFKKRLASYPNCPPQTPRVPLSRHSPHARLSLLPKPWRASLYQALRAIPFSKA